MSHPARKTPAGHPAKRKPVARAAAASPQQVMYDTAVSERVSDRVLRALFLIGTAENDWNVNTCNASNHCGIFQLDANWQRQHDYRDVAYWTNRAINDGFYGYGGLSKIDQDHPSWSIGEMVQACQGAGPTFAAAAKYYDSRLAESDAILARYKRGGVSRASQPSQSGPAYFNPLAHARVTPERIDQGVDYAGTGYLTAIADGVITHYWPGGWGQYGNYLEYKITQPGPLNGVYIFYAEGITPVVHEGERVRGGSRLADLIPGWHSGIEIGFSAGDGQPHSYYAYHDGHYTEGTATRPGIAFSNLIERLGGPGGKIEGSVVGNFPEYQQSGEPAPSVQTGDQVGAGGGGVGGGITASGQFDWPGDALSAFVQVQRGAGQASHHSHAAWFYARGVTYVPKSD